MWGIKKWLVGTVFSCINRVEEEDQQLVCSYPNIIPRNISSSTTPVHTNNIDIYASEISTNNKEEKEEAKQDNVDFAPSFRYFVFNTESRNPSQQHLNPQVEEFSFWPSNDSAPDQESDEPFLQDQILPTLLSSCDGESAENTLPPISSSNEPGIPGEDSDLDDLKDCFECPEVNAEIAQRWKLHGGDDEEEEEEDEKQDDRDQILPALMISCDGDQTATDPPADFPPIPSSSEEHSIPDLEDYFVRLNAAIRKLYGGCDEEKEEDEKQDVNKEPFQRPNLPIRIVFKGRSTSSPQKANKPGCCIVPRQITKAEISHIQEAGARLEDIRVKSKAR